MRTIKKITSVAVTTTLLFLMLTALNLQAQEDFKIRGRIHMDALYGITDADAFSNGFNNRRARMGMGGKMTDKWDGRIEVDFADGGVSPNDFRMRRSFDHGGRLWLGQFKVPMGLNELTSSNEITFIERASSSNIIADSRRIGAAYEYFGGSAGFKTMVYGRALGQRGSVVDNMPLGAAIRGVYFADIAGGILHIGSSVAYEDLMENESVSFSDRPEARDSKGGSVRLIRANVDSLVESTFKAGAELLYLNGPFSIEAEYLTASVSLEAGDEPTFFGYHVQASYVLTGESRKYSKGALGTVTPSGDIGAWELALRYSFADLNDAGYTGGEQTNITVGVNHYVTSKLRFMANVIFVNLKDSDDSPILGLIRAQYNF